MTYCVKAVRVLAMFVIFVVCCVSEDGCKRASYTKVMLGITDTNHTCAELTLKKNFDEWKFSENLLLSLPCEQNEDNSIREVGNVIFSNVRPTPLKKGVQLAAFSGDALRSVLDMNTAVVKTRDFLFMASGWDTVPDTTPLSHRYGGHQFGVWAGQLGDGRAHLLGQYVNRFGERWELQLKGSGRTPYSRGGDGRAVIRSSVREFLCSEAMHFLGIPTSRAASLVVSDDRVMRDRFYDGSPRPERAAVVLRLAKSWFRFGSFEILACSGEIPLLRQLADFIIEHHFPDIPSNDTDRYAMLYQSVVEDTAHLVAKWQSVGFTHGVCNTDNFSILSFTIDYGPFRFMDAYDPDMVPNTSDDERRYSYKKQPDVAYYNLDKLREAIQVLLPVEQHFVLRQILNGFMDRYKSYYVELFCKKLGFLDVEDTDQYLIASLLDIMADVEADFTMTFQHLSEWNLDTSQLEGSSSNLWTLNQLWSHENFRQWLQLYKDRLSNSNIEEAERRQVMLAANPRYVPRNWIIEQIIDQVEEDTFDLLQKTLELFKNPYNYQKEAEELGYADQPPAWAKQIKVSCSS